MRNAFYPSFTSQLCSFGNNEIQMPISDISLSSVCGSSFFHDSQVSSEHHLGSFAPLSTLEIPPQSFNSLHLPGWLTTNTAASSTLDKTSQSYFPSRSLISDTKTSGDVGTENASRKRKIKCEFSSSSSLEDRRAMEESSKKNKVVLMEDKHACLPYSQGRQLEEATQVAKIKAPAKRSLKISDKITVLQKLVSPFGKTDTASVLQEAHSYIKYLQEQIEMLSAPYLTTIIRPLHSLRAGGSNMDLCSRGLCLVPLSCTHNLNHNTNRRDDHQPQRCASSSSSKRPTFSPNY